jgi:hypothetical protein
MKKSFAFFSFLTLLSIRQVAAEEKKYTIGAADIQRGYITERIELKNYAPPNVLLTEPEFAPLSLLPKDAPTGDPSGINIRIGMERKRPFALVRIPAYSKGADGTFRQLTSFTLDVQEPAAPTNTGGAQARGTAASSSVLATGTWHKIALSARGIYKIDYAFLQSKLGLSGNINSASIRLFGNGGQMLSENNAVARPDDLVENAIAMNDGSDGTFGSGDYFTFYAGGPTAWEKDNARQRFIPHKNLYADSAYYFITVDGGSGTSQRIGTQASVPLPNVTVTDFNEYQLHEQDLYNPGSFGKEWLGEQMGNLTTNGLSRIISFDIGTATSDIDVATVLASRSSAAGSTITVSMNGQQLGIAGRCGIYPGFCAVTLAGDQDPYGSASDSFIAPAAGSNTASFQFTYNPTVNDGIGYINSVTINYRRALTYTGGAMSFRDLASLGTGRVAGYRIEGATAGLQVWDVTDPLHPVRMSGTLSGSVYTFAQDAATLHEFVATDGTRPGVPAYIGKVSNQNIHGTPEVDFLIVTHPTLLKAANKLADFHRRHDNMKVLVATTDQVYNEFSSGGQDISAIRDMARMFYVRAGNDTTQMPKNILLFGDASYDYKNRIAGNTNLVPTYEADESVAINASYVVDEFYAMLDDNENIENISLANTLDIGVGRIPVQTENEADAIVEKIIAYKSPASFGPWRLNNTYIGDNEDDAGYHLLDAENMMGAVTTETGSLYNNSKIYLDNYPFVSTPAGLRCPDGTKALNDAVFRGTFLINYSGHGNPTALAHERILTMNDLNNWKNLHKLPFMVTATCDFARFDNPSYNSAGERLVVKPDGGAIAMLTTTAPVYAGLNDPINRQFLQNQFDQRMGAERNTFGEAYRRGKNKTYNQIPDFFTLINNRAFILLGDPALTPNFPNLDHKVRTDSIIDLSTNASTDTFKALGAYKIIGSVADENNNLMAGFNGRAYVTIYDKARVIDLFTKVYRHERIFEMQDNVVFKGIATVTGGRFSFSFIAPKDINYDFGKGKFSYYAENGVTDAAGIDTSVNIGGFSDNPSIDNDGPMVKAYMNDTLFRNGSITGSNTMLYVQLADETGINASGNSIGHDITAILDGNEAMPYVMNDYYETEPNTYKRGHVRFPVTGLAEGKHTFTITAWDVNNNAGEGKVDFEVVNGNVVRINNLMNYPNPFSDITHFVFEHNHPNETYKVQIGIFSTDGRIVRTLEQTFIPSGSHSNELTWNGTDGNGAKLPSGVYPYKMILTTEKGIQETAYQKLVLIR